MHQPPPDDLPAAPRHPRLSYAELAFDEHVRARQRAVGAHRRIDEPAEGGFEFEPADRKLIANADMAMIGTVTGAGWPYVQHRGGPPGFVRILGPDTLAIPDLAGNQQYVTAGNIDRDGRVCLFLVDFPTRRRLKVFGRARVLDAAGHPELVERLRDLGGGRRLRSRIERVLLIRVTAVDANCAKHITPRWDREYIDGLTGLYRADIEDLKARLAQAEAELDRLRGAAGRG